MKIRAVQGVSAVIALGVYASAQVNAPCEEYWINHYIALADDAVASVHLGFTFPGPNGVNYTDIDIGSNGFIYLGTNPAHDARCCDGNASAFCSGDPAIAAIWEDLDPTDVRSAGGVYFNPIAASPGYPARGVISWVSIAEVGGGPYISAQIQLLDTGEFVIHHGGNNAVARHTVLVGATQGLGATPNPIVLPRVTGSVTTGTNPTAYQLFNSATYDIAGSSWEFVPNGLGGYTISERGICHHANFAKFGQGCPALSGQTVYELFPPGTMDLSNTSIQFQPNGMGGWTVIPGSGSYFNGLSNSLHLNDDDVALGIALPFPFVHGGTICSTIDVASNGFVWIDSSGQADPRWGDADVPHLIQNPPSLCPMWMNLDPTAGGGVYADADPSGQVFYVTWDQVPEYYNGAPQTFQLALYPSGVFEFRFRSCLNLSHTMIVGATEGYSFLDPGSRDLSTAVPFDTGLGGPPLSLDSRNGAYPRLGSAFALNVLRIPAHTPLGFLLISPRQIGTPLAAFGMPDCKGYVDLSPGGSVVMVFPVVNSTVTLPLPIPANAGLAGVTLYAQAATLSNLYTPLGVIASNGAQIAIGN